MPRKYPRPPEFTRNVMIVRLTVPCHRGIHADGTIIGYAYRVEVKEALLDCEGGPFQS
jgi:O6-methylguanine-DNA--protein-cysteine methyltransferase